MAKWLMYSKRADFTAMGKKYQIDPVVARILVNRDLTEDAAITAFLHPSEKDLGDGKALKDMDVAVALLQKAIKEKKKIRIIGDYDIDGIQATYILHQGLLRLGAIVDYAIPDRIEDGYGVNIRLMEKCVADGIGLVITCDNGIAAADAIAYAKEAGIEVIVTDHHEVPYEMVEGKKVYHLPPADAVVDPKREDCMYPCKKLCGAVVAWKVIWVLYEAAGIASQEAMRFMENAAFATIGDVMELVEENRTIVALGIDRLRHTKNLGMQTLIARCDLAPEDISAYHVGFVLGPCLNASGRLDSATKALELLEAEDIESAAGLAETLRQLNEERKVMTEQGVAQAIAQIEQAADADAPVLVIYLPQVHESVAGIIAGRIRERYERPTFILVNAADGNGAKGSGRSVEGFSMYDEMCKCKELFSKFGGHPMAAGLSLPVENIDAFRTAINANTQMTKEEMQTVIHIDVPMPFSYIREDLISQLEILEPFGNGNPKPIFAQKNVRIMRKIPIGKQKQFLRMDLQGEDGFCMEGLYFGDVDAFEEIEREKGCVTITYYPQLNDFRGRRSLQIVISNVC